ncbi:hypothetical protein [Arthrobacter rhizosphaerae]|uniref:hypothetical protein n=1 Tax=Arthrobacter rhizosphaerae TaxID=2855490 RepID=UPI001FF1DF5F|nr:hypothetical protein [Arthrobacter rhizosphaerae]
MAEDFKRPSPRYGWLAGPASVALGACAHLISGTQIPGLLVLLALTALIGLAATLLGRLLASGWSLLVFCGLIQQLLHLALDFFSSAPGGGSPRHGHDGVDWQLPEVPMGAASPHSGELMVDTHVAAALLAALLLATLRSHARSGDSERSRI